MAAKGVLTKILALAGAILVWIPILFTILISVIGTIASRILRFDYLMPAELFPVALIGALLLMWAALRSHSYRKLIGLGLGTAVIFLIGGQAIAVISGLASGETEPAGLAWALVVGSIVVYSLSLIELCVAGVLLVRKLYITNSRDNRYFG